MGFLDLLTIEEGFRPSPLNEKQKRFISRAYKKNLHNPEFFYKVCEKGDNQCMKYQNKAYQILLKTMVYNWIDKLNDNQSSVEA